MNNRILAIVLFAIVVGIGACGKKRDTNCDITAFSTNPAPNAPWKIEGTTIEATFAKNTNVSALAPNITVSPKATVVPASGVAQDFSGGKVVQYTVTAEDGKTKKTYSAKATVLTE